MTNGITNMVWVLNSGVSLDTDWARVTHYFTGGFSWGFYLLAGWWAVFVITRALRAPRWPGGGE